MIQSWIFFGIIEQENIFLRTNQYCLSHEVDNDALLINHSIIIIIKIIDNRNYDDMIGQSSGVSNIPGFQNSYDDIDNIDGIDDIDNSYYPCDVVDIFFLFFFFYKI